MSSSFRSVLFKNFSVKRLWSAWTRGYLVSSVVRRCRERAVKEVLQCFRHAFLRPRRTFLISVTAAYNSRSEETSDCDVGITDNELEKLLTELDVVKELVKSTLQCSSCGKRLVIDKKQTSVQYCDCKDGQPAEQSSDGWVPYMEAEDVIIWRKEYKPGQGLYAYKVYGRYPELNARDFAAVQLDGAYRRAWDAAVAALAVVQRSAKGVHGQAVLHWEVLWPRLFANRDYVYIRRHKEFDVFNERFIQSDKNNVELPTPILNSEMNSVHAKAKRKSMEEYERERDRRRSKIVNNKVYIIVSRSCEHPDVPETKHAIRVLEYWSHMVVKTIEGTEKPGMEFVLTYYDEPAVGGMPGGVAAWASGRAAPAYLARMRRAARDYRAWADTPRRQEMPDFTPLDPEFVSEQNENTSKISEEDMESSKEGPEMENSETTRDQSTQTDEMNLTKVEETHEKAGETKQVMEDKFELAVKDKDDKDREVKEVERSEENVPQIETLAKCAETSKELSSELEGEENNGGWWRYLYPYYYFV